MRTSCVLKKKFSGGCESNSGCVDVGQDAGLKQRRIYLRVSADETVQRSDFNTHRDIHSWINATEETAAALLSPISEAHHVIFSIDGLTFGGAKRIRPFFVTHHGLSRMETTKILI